jgi:Sensors of blue-light using FAD
MLTRLIYYSENHLGSAEGGKMIGDLNAIMDCSNRNNEKDGITGALLFDTLWFVQILEGERDMVSATLRRILKDERHDNVVIIDARPARQRFFGNWWMGLSFLRGDQTALYRRHNIGERLNPRVMSGEQTVELALDLASTGLNRRIAAPA